MKQQQKLPLKEKELIRQNGPFLNPGIVDYVCVVGAKNLCDLRGDDRTRGWIDSKSVGERWATGGTGEDPNAGFWNSFPTTIFIPNTGGEFLFVLDCFRREF